jgi:hypothetical protein
LKQNRTNYVAPILNYDDRECIQKIIIFEICPNFPTFLCNCPEFFFRKLIQNPNKQNQKKITHSHRSNPVMILSSYKKALSVFPELF